MTELARWLDNPLVLVGLCAVVGGGFLFLIGVTFTNHYDRGGYERRHGETKDRPPTLPDTDEPEADAATFPRFVPAPARHHHRFAGAPDEGTRRLYPTTSAARSRVVMIGPEGIESGNHAGETGRVRPSQNEDVEEEGSEDRERREDEGGTIRNGEEGGAYTEAPQSVACPIAGWYRNTDTGEYVFVDEFGRKVDWQAQ